MGFSDSQLDSTSSFVAALSKENRNYRYMLTGGSLKTIRSTQPETFLAINSHLKGTTWAFSLQIYSANNKAGRRFEEVFSLLS